ncbi:S41 family peptidase [Sphingomicrobium clamense]|uniref:S41 family peptidase n=1 Tax=Sphingomicrobium clamense TaxID=2851013 RepID=A0ABS6V4R0_9SPHN|nr:S41 family peptidase [Sphingomicrobium sp. B8]MBW0144537.1 S41 family peptidase [Sphingomicrobium sp. B8]
MLFSIVALLAVAAVGYDLLTYDRAAWQADYERLKDGMAEGYANLDWQVEQRNLDLEALDSQTGEALDGSFSHIQAFLALRRFVDAFDDPHLGMHFGQAPETATLLPMESSTAPGTDCASAGYETENLASDLSYTAHPDWKPVASRDFPAGTIGETGIVRIAAFGENKYKEACAEAAEAGLDARALQLATRKRLNAHFDETLSALREAGAKRLVIDATGNGGGSEWIADIVAKLGEGNLGRSSPLLADPACDRRAIWEGQKVCPVLKPNAKKEWIEGSGLWTGPISLLLDRRSASATEGFAVWLADNDRAVLVGERTFGAGCGYIDGGHAVQLKAAPLYVLMPNCARFTAAGVNEIEGIEPDLPADLSSMPATEFPELFDRAFMMP